MIFCSLVLELHLPQNFCHIHTGRHFLKIVKSWPGHPKTCKSIKNRKSKIWTKPILSFIYTCPLLALLVNSHSQGLRLLQPILAKSHLNLANIKQILIHFVYMRDQEKQWELQTFIWVFFQYTGPNLAKWTALWKISSKGITLYSPITL